MATGLTQILSKIGNQNLECQSLIDSLANVKVGKKDAIISFYTPKAFGQEMCNRVATGVPVKKAALVV